MDPSVYLQRGPRRAARFDCVLASLLCRLLRLRSLHRKISSFEKTVYFITLLCVAISAVLLLAPSIHHRILFRQREKGYLVSVANRMAIWGMIFLAFGSHHFWYCLPSLSK